MFEIIHSNTQKLLNIQNCASGFFWIILHMHILLPVICPRFVHRNTYHHISLHIKDGIQFQEIIRIKTFQEVVIPF